MDKLSDDMPEAYDKLKEAEEFQSMIKADLRRVEGEKQAYYYRRGELDVLIKNTVGVLVIATVSAVICFIVLLVLGLSMNMDVKLGFLLTVTIICGVYCFLFLKGNDLRKESNKLEKTIIKIIQLQNSVKIRLVNNTNLLDYLYLKYDVDSSKELKANFESYETERTRREQYEQASKDLPMAKKLLLSLLRDLPISDPISWVHTPEAIVNKNEMVELRHEMISRRQKLREQIEDSTGSAEGIKEEIKEIIKRYPRYSVEIMEMLKDFESTNKFE